MRSHTCPKCQGSMAEGYIAQEKSGMQAVSHWSQGAPEKKWWGIKAVKKPLEIRTWRCNRCGFLESYAE